MAKIEEMNKEQVEKMLRTRADVAILMDELDKKYPDMFCGVALNEDMVLHIYKPQTLRKMAEILEKPVKIEKYTEEQIKDLTYHGQVSFMFEYAEKKWKVFSLYEDESEVVG